MLVFYARVYFFVNSQRHCVLNLHTLFLQPHVNLHKIDEFAFPQAFSSSLEPKAHASFSAAVIMPFDPRAPTLPQVQDGST